jgi:hypothetical protein
MIGNVSFEYRIGVIWQKKEAVIWISALAFLAMSDPAIHHYTLCPLDNLGISICPGCGLGRSIGYFFRADIESSVLSHPLGIPAIILLIYRSVSILVKPGLLNLSTLK